MPQSTLVIINGLYYLIGSIDTRNNSSAGERMNSSGAESIICTIEKSINRAVNYCFEFSTDHSGKAQITSKSKGSQRKLLADLLEDINSAGARKFFFADWYKGFMLVEIKKADMSQKFLFQINSLDNLYEFYNYVKTGLLTAQLPLLPERLSVPLFSEQSLLANQLDAKAPHFGLLLQDLDSDCAKLRISGVACYSKDANLANTVTTKINLFLKFDKDGDDVWNLDAYSLLALDEQLQVLESALAKAETDAKIWHSGVAFIEKHIDLMERDFVVTDNNSNLLSYELDDMKSLEALYNIINSYKSLSSLTRCTSNDFVDVDLRGSLTPMFSSISSQSSPNKPEAVKSNRASQIYKLIRKHLSY